MVSFPCWLFSLCLWICCTGSLISLWYDVLYPHMHVHLLLLFDFEKLISWPLRFSPYHNSCHRMKTLNTTLSEQFGRIPKSIWKTVERDKIDFPKIQIHDGSLSWLGTDMNLLEQWFVLTQLWCRIWFCYQLLYRMPNNAIKP